MAKPIGDATARLMVEEFGCSPGPLLDNMVGLFAKPWNEPTGWSNTKSLCHIEAVGDFYDTAAEAGEFGRAQLNYGALPEEELQDWGYPEYDPGTAEELLTIDQADALQDEVPCVNEPCKNGIHGYQYNFRFETVMGDVAVVAQLDYFTTDVSGDLQPEYRSQAIAAFTASMDAIATELQ